MLLRHNHTNRARVLVSQRKLAWLGLATVLAMLLSFFPQIVPGAQVPSASAHNLNASVVYVFFDPDTQSILDARVAAPTWSPPKPLLQVGDELGIIIKAVPDLGTTTGVGGYTTFYVPNGLQVVDAAFLQPSDAASDGITGWDRIPAKGQARMPAVGAGGDATVSLAGIKRGPNILGMTSDIVADGTSSYNGNVFAANTNLGTIVGVYGDTGIFYSTAPETAFGTYSGGSITNNSGDIVGARTILGTTLNKWDAWQMAGYGIKATTNPNYPSIAIVDASNQRGYAPWGMANVVAGPLSGYAWQFDFDKYTQCMTAKSASPKVPDRDCINTATQDMGPWQRIKYYGSQVSDDPPGDRPAVQPYTRGADASQMGVALSPSTPLPATVSQTDTTSPKAIRFAYGQLTQNVPQYAWVKVRVQDTTAILDQTGCPKWTVDTFGGDAGGESGGKDHIWRYYDPNSVTFNGCLAIGKPATRELVHVGDTFQYKVKLYNMGSKDFSIVQVKDTLPPGATYVSAVPAPDSVSLPYLTWNVSPFLRGQKFEATVTVKAASGGLITNSVCANGTVKDSTETISSCGSDTTLGGDLPLLSQTKTVSVTSAKPGDSLNYQIKIDNIGTGPTGTPVVVTDFLPAGFTYTGAVPGTIAAKVNGASISASVTGTTAKPVISVSQAIKNGYSLVIDLPAQIGSSVMGGRYCNYYTTSQNDINLTTGTLACVDVSRASIGDTVYRDWNGNGQQDTGEEGIPGIQVCANPGSQCATTDANGKYLIAGLQAGTYSVDVTNPPSGYTAKQGAHPTSVTLGPTDNNMTVDFGYQPGGTGTIGDQVFDDQNNDKLFDGSDVGIDGVTVKLYEDTNGDGRLDPVNDVQIGTKTTSGGGTYQFTGLDPARGYLVSAVDGAGSGVDTYFTTSYVLSTVNPQPVSPQDFTTQGNDVTTADFGYFGQTPGSIGDTVCRDTNTNSLCESGEPGIPGVTVFLYVDLNGDGQPDTDAPLATTSTDATGTYRFSNLGPGPYAVVVDDTDPSLPDGYVPEIDTVAHTLGVGENYNGADFPFIPVIVKSVDKTAAQAGDKLLFTVNVDYRSSDMLTNVRVVDPLPVGTTFDNTYTPSMGGTYGTYSPVAGQPGVDDFSTYQNKVTLTASPTAVATGATINVSMVVANGSGTAMTGVTPSALTIVGGTGSCSAPPAAQNIAAGGSATFSYTCSSTTLGELSFDGAASTADYDFPDGVSNTVLVSKSGSSSVITWNLGSNDLGTPAAVMSSGRLPAIYAFQGKSTKKVWRYNILLNTWTDIPADLAVAVNEGGALSWDAGSYLYAFNGKTNGFYRYTLPTDQTSAGTWTTMANAPATTGWGGALTTVGGATYAFGGGGGPGGTKFFWSYAPNAWNNPTDPADALLNVKEGGALTNDGTNVYGLRGAGQKDFWKYTIASNSWTALASIPQSVKKGGALTYLNGYIYALQGNNLKGFFRYDIASNTWKAMASTPANVEAGGALTNDGTYVYAFEGNEKNLFWRYDIAANKWTAMANAPATVKQGGALKYVPATGSADLTTALSVTPAMINSGQTVQLVMTLTSKTALTGVTPSTPSVSGTNSASASCGAASPASQSMSADVPAYFTWTCTVTTGTALPGTVQFQASATGSPSATFGTAKSNTVIAIRPLTFQVSVNSNPGVNVIDNYALLSDDGGSIGTGIPSNTTHTTLGAIIGDHVWADLDGDGIQDTGEPGVPGVQVCATPSAGGTSVCTTTDLNGDYKISGLTAGSNYTVAITPPANYVPTTPATLTSVTAQVSPGNLTADFGLLPPGQGKIGDTVWLDANGDGSVNGTEQGLPNISVKLEIQVGASWVQVATTTTDASGKYEFDNLHAGTYRVTVDTGSSVTSPYDGTTTIAAAMAATTGTVNPHTITLATESSVDLTADFGYNWGGAIGDTVWYDTNQDQAQDNGETGIDGATVLLYFDADNDGVIDETEYVPVAFMDTSGGGKYKFNNLPPGNYLVDVYEDSITSNGIRNIVPTTPEVRKVTLPGSTYIDTADFGYYVGAEVQGNVFWDENRNGLLDSSENNSAHLLENVAVNISCYGADGVAGGGDDYAGSVSTDPNGHFRFIVPAGPCTLTYDTADPDIPTALGDATTPTSYTFTAIAGEDWHPSYDFGRDNTGKIGDTVWSDADGNGSQNGEPGLSGVTVWIYQDTNNNNAVDTGEPLLAALPTDDSGKYLFEGLADGNYVVEVNPATLPANFTPTYDNFGAADGLGQADISGGTAVLTVDFGYKYTPSGNPTLYTISGRVYNDENDNHDDNGEPGFPGVDVTVACNFGTFVVKSDSTGAWSLPGIAAGSTCTVLTANASDLPRKDFAATETPAVPVTVNGTVTGLDFGYYQTPSSISGTVCLGTGNGKCDLAETGIAGVTVTLNYAGPDGFMGTADDVAMGTATTDANGHYQFTGLQPGLYEILETNPPNHISVADVDGGNPDNIAVQLAFNTNKTGQDFEDAKPVIGAAKSAVSITDNANGTYTVVYDILVQNYGHMDLTGVQVTDNLRAAFPLPVTLSGISVTSSTFTVNASYSPPGNSNLLAGTDGLAAGASGTIHLAVTVGNVSVTTTYNNQAIATGNGPSGTTTSDPSDNGINPDPNGNGNPDEAGENDPTPVSFGAICTTHVYGRIWRDWNRNMIQDPGDPLEYGLQYVKVSLLDNSRPDRPTVAEATTNANGDWVFSDVPPGKYIIDIDQGYITSQEGLFLTTGQLGPVDFELGACGTKEINAGYGPLADGMAAVGNLLWFDANLNGLQDEFLDENNNYTVDKNGVEWSDMNGNNLVDEGEVEKCPLRQVTVKLYDTSGSTEPLRTTKSDHYGNYEFFNLPANAAYRVDVDPLDPNWAASSAEYQVDGLCHTIPASQLGYISTGLLPPPSPSGPGGSGSAPLAGVNAAGVVTNALTEASVPVTHLLKVTPALAAASAPAAGEAAIRGQVRVDRDADGNFADPEEGLAGVTIELWADNNNSGLKDTGDTLEGTTTTGSDGTYVFSSVAPGHYVVVETDLVLDASGDPIYRYASTADTDSPSDNQIAVTLAAGVDSTGNDFLDVLTTCRLMNPYGTVTYLHSGDINFGLDYESICSTNLPSAIGDYVWYDSNGNGVQDVGEPGIANVKLTLYMDANDNGIFDGVDTAVATTYTDADGGYLFQILSGGTYFVDVADASNPDGLLSGMTHTSGPQSKTDPTGAIVITAEGGVYKDADFGYRRVPAAGKAIVGDTIWFDDNGDGIQQPGELGIPGVTVKVYDSSNNVLGSAVTDSNGHYLVEVPSGSGYYVQPDPATVPAGLTATTPQPATLPALASGQQYLDADLGYDDAGQNLLGTIGNLIFVDADKNGSYGAGDSALAGVSVDLIRDTNDDGEWDAGEPIVATVTSVAPVDALFGINGNYRFTGVPAGKYLVHVSDTNAVLSDFARAPLGETNVDGENQADPYAVSLSTGQDVPTADLAYYKPVVPGSGLIGNQVWLEPDGNGVFNPEVEDAGVPGVTLDLYLNGVFIATTTTGASGDYSFVHLPPGSYTVRVTDVQHVLSGRVPATYPADQASDGTNKVQPFAVTLASGGYNLTADFGYAGTVPGQAVSSIGDFVWWDVNGNGLQDGGEPGIPDVKVNLYVLGSGAPVATTTTGSSGLYQFNGLEGSVYRVEIDPGEFAAGGTLAGWSGSPAKAGSDPALDSNGDPTSHDAAVTILPASADTATDFGFVFSGGDYRVTKVRRGPAMVRQGSLVTYDITVENTGTTYLGKVSVADTYNTQYLSFFEAAETPPADLTDDGQLDWPNAVTFADELAPNLSWTVSVTFVAAKDTTKLDGSTTPNTARVSEALVDPDGPSGPLPALLPLSVKESTADVTIVLPTGLDASGFSANPAVGGVELTWSTACEQNIVGFNILRKAADSELVAVNSELIVAQNVGICQGATYSYEDHSVPAGSLVYALQVVRLDGSADVMHYVTESR